MKRQKEDIVRKPSFFLYSVLATILRPVTFFWWNLRINRKGIKGLKAPFVAIINHSSTMDVVCTIQGLMPHRCNVITSKDLFTWPILKKGIRAFGCIPKSQCSVDLPCLKMMKKGVNNGRNIILYPEGRTSLDGRNLYYISPSIAKLVKLLGVTVVGVKTNGGYLAKPRYFRGFRRGRVEVTPTVLLTKEEVKALSYDELYEKIKEFLKFNDNVWQRENNITVHSKHLARDLNYILYKCPRCGAEYEMSSDDKYLTCNACGNKVEYTKNGYLLPIGKDSKAIDRIDLWYEFEKESILKEIESEDFFISKEVDYQIENQIKYKFETRGKGQLFIDKKYIGYRGTKDGENIEIKQELSTLSAIITKNEEGIDLIVDDNIHRFLFTEHKWSTKYGLIVEVNFARENGLLNEKSEN